MTIYDIAEQAHVSIATVSRVLNNKPNVSEKSRAKVMQVLENSDYKPSAIAQGLVHNTSNYISIIIEDIRHTHYISIAYYLENSLKEYGYSCIINNCKADDIDDFLSTVTKSRPAGIVLIGSIFSNKKTEQAINTHVNNLPIVMINGNLSCPNVTSIFPDDRGGIALSVHHLLENGHKNIYFIKDNTTWSSRRKLEGYKDTMEIEGMSDAMTIMETTNSVEGGKQIAKKLLETQPWKQERIALIFSEDVTASGCLQELLRNEVKVPEEVAIIGYDDSDICIFSMPNMTSINSRPDIVGQEAARTLATQSSDTRNLRSLVVSPILVERETV